MPDHRQQQLADGRSVVIRAATRTDLPGLVRHFAATWSGDRPPPSSRELSQQLGYVLIATFEGRIVGVANYIKLEHRRARAAVTPASGWESSGLPSLLWATLVRGLARDEVDYVAAAVDVDDAQTLAAFRPLAHGVIRFVLDLNRLREEVVVSEGLAQRAVEAAARALGRTPAELEFLAIAAVTHIHKGDPFMPPPAFVDYAVKGRGRTGVQVRGDGWIISFAVRHYTGEWRINGVTVRREPTTEDS